MTKPSPRHLWQTRWTVDRQAGTVHHECGLTVHMGGAGPRALNDQQVLQALAPKHGHNAVAMVQRMLREAAAVWAAPTPREARL